METTTTTALSAKARTNSVVVSAFLLHTFAIDAHTNTHTDAHACRRSVIQTRTQASKRAHACSLDDQTDGRTSAHHTHLERARLLVAQTHAHTDERTHARTCTGSIGGEATRMSAHSYNLYDTLAHTHGQTHTHTCSSEQASVARCAPKYATHIRTAHRRRRL